MRTEVGSSGDDGRHRHDDAAHQLLRRPRRRRAGLINDGLAPSSSVLDTVAESDLFAQGQIAITWSDFTAVPTYEEAEIDFGMTPSFVVEGQEDFVETWTAPWGTFTESPHAADALLFVGFMVTDAQEIQMEVAPDPPLSTVVAEEASYGGDDPIKHQYMRTIPTELDEAARIDGAGFWTIYWKIIMPLCIPALVVVGVFTFLGVWNDFFGPLLYLDDPNWSTVPLALAREATTIGTEWNIVMAATLVAMLPPLIVYAFSQNKLMGGIASVGIRG